MSRWLLRAPAWELAVVFGLPMAVVVFLLERFGRGESWADAGITGVLVAVVCGALLGAILRRRFRRLLDSVGEAPDEVRMRVASRGTLRGPLPEDPAVRAATATLIDSQLAELRRKRWSGGAMHAVLIGLCAWLALARSPWWWLGVVFFVGSLVLLLRIPGLLERRAQRLRQEA